MFGNMMGIHARAVLALLGVVIVSNAASATPRLSRNDDSADRPQAGTAQHPPTPTSTPAGNSGATADSTSAGNAPASRASAACLDEACLEDGGYEQAGAPGPDQAEPTFTDPD